MDVEIQIEKYEKYDKDDVDNPLDPHEKRDKDEIVPHKPRDSKNAHNGNQVSSVSLSPNGKYVVTYSEDDKSIEGWIVKDSSEDDKSIEGWIVKDSSEDDKSIEGCSKLILDPEASIYKLLSDELGYIREIKVNNDKIVCFVNKINEIKYKVETFRMSKKNQQIKLNPPPERWWLLENINFKKNGDLILSNRYEISIYLSNQSNVLSLMPFYVLLSYNDVIKEVLIDDDNIWVITLSYLFHWDLKTVQLKFSYSLGFTTTYKSDEKFTVITKGNSIAVNYSNEISIFLKEQHYPIRNIQLIGTNIKIEFCVVQNNVYLLAFNIPEKDEKQDIILYSITDIQPIDASKIFNKNNNFILYKYNSESKEAFGLVDGKFSCINLVNLNLHELYEFFEPDDDLVVWNDYLGQTFEKYYYNDTLAFPDMENIRSLLSETRKNIEGLFSDEYENKNIATNSEPSDKYENKYIDIDFNNQKYKWRIGLKTEKLDKDNKLNKLVKLSVYSGKEFLCSKDLGIKLTTLNWKILNNNALALRLRHSIIIYEYDIHKKYKKCINTQYFNYKMKGLDSEDFSGSILPMTFAKNVADIILLKDKDEDMEECSNNREQYYTACSESIVSIIKDDRCLAKYGPTLLSNLIKSTDSRFTCHIEDIYNKCIKLVKEDPKGNLKFLNIITSSMNDLFINYPGYIPKFNSEMFMILNPYNERIWNNHHSHFKTFSHEVEILKANKNIRRIFKYIMFTYVKILYLTTSILCLPFTILMKQSKQQIVLIVPYIDYSRYPLGYSWWKEIFYPPSNVFTDTCIKEFYSNWNGEAIINFKWNTFGRIYYFIIWLLFLVFLVCFTIASYPTNSITQEIRIKLYQTTIAFGFYHLLFELRQFIWNPKKYFSSIWNLFDLSAYLSATIASIYWIKYDDIPDWALSISCLLLDLKFLLFFRIFEYFGVYFAIIFGVAKRVFSFLVVLAIIIASFAHAFFLLLHPQDLLDSLSAQNLNDPNNPWTLSNTYNQVDENGNILKETLIQVPSENTNLFYSYPTSLLATYLFLTGNQNSLSPWAPNPTTENTILFLLIAVFSFLIVIYLMNLFIGLLNIAIEEDNDRASYLVQKAEVIAEIELFYLLPHQKRWGTCYYQVDIKKARKYIKEAIKNGEWKKDDWPEMRNKILKLLNIEDAIKD
ncbi:hypothetical protein RhiirA4_464594 [Rhizophagus irregularis]|uniref:Ion transport domain-containing protein n=1 Tax=Rhizophagus irregularis TaxID=588596 RepID=A0A2I1GQE2_9GLOM|nr:hypothetical protein RhiirA4_464594 [Rhizophagus irregularis]